MWKKVVYVIVFVSLLATGLLIRSIKNQPPIPELQVGDLVFQTAPSSQNKAIMWATKSMYSHVGIVDIVRGKTYVMEAGPVVRMVPFDDWRESGYGRWITIKRMQGMKPELATLVMREARRHAGEPYDFMFMFDNQAVYCSELPYISFQAINIKLGKVQKIEELDVSNPLTEKLIKERWKMHPVCLMRALDYDRCRKVIMEQPLITPRSLSEDSRLETIYSSYPF